MPAKAGTQRGDGAGPPPRPKDGFLLGGRNDGWVAPFTPFDKYPGVVREPPLQRPTAATPTDDSGPLTQVRGPRRACEMDSRFRRNDGWGFAPLTPFDK